MREMSVKLNDIDTYLKSLPPNSTAPQKRRFQPKELVDINLKPKKIDYREKLLADLENVCQGARLYTALLFFHR